MSLFSYSPTVCLVLGKQRNFHKELESHNCIKCEITGVFLSITLERNIEAMSRVEISSCSLKAAKKGKENKRSILNVA